MPKISIILEEGLSLLLISRYNVRGSTIIRCIVISRSLGYIRGMLQLSLGKMGRHDHDLWQIDLQLPMQSVPNTTDVIKFVNDLWQVGGFLQVVRFPPPIELTATIQLKYCRKWHQTPLNKQYNQVNDSYSHLSE